MNDILFCIVRKIVTDFMSCLINTHVKFERKLLATKWKLLEGIAQPP